MRFDQIEVKLSQFDSRFVVNNQSLKSIGKKLEGFDENFKAIDQNFKAIDQKFNTIEQKLVVFDQNFKAIDQNFKFNDEKFERIFKEIDDLKKGQKDNINETLKVKDFVKDELISELKSYKNRRFFLF